MLWLTMLVTGCGGDARHPQPGALGKWETAKTMMRFCCICKSALGIQVSRCSSHSCVSFQGVAAPRLRLRCLPAREKNSIEHERPYMGQRLGRHLPCEAKLKYYPRFQLDET